MADFTIGRNINILPFQSAVYGEKDVMGKIGPEKMRTFVQVCTVCTKKLLATRKMIPDVQEIYVFALDYHHTLCFVSVSV